MRINGKQPNLFRSQVLNFQDIGGDVYAFTLTPPPLNFYDMLEKIIPTPVPPRTFAKDAKGKLEKDENGRAIVIRDEDDLKYREKLKEAQRLHNTALVYEVLKNDKAIEFDTKPALDIPAGKALPDAEFYKNILMELLQLIPMPVFLKILETSGKMLSVSDEALKEAEESFRN